MDLIEGRRSPRAGSVPIEVLDRIIAEGLADSSGKAEGK
jgi:hypothetical protein